MFTVSFCVHSCIPPEEGVVTFGTLKIKTHGSESRGQEEAGLRDERVSYLQCEFC